MTNKIQDRSDRSTKSAPHRTVARGTVTQGTVAQGTVASGEEDEYSPRPDAVDLAILEALQQDGRLSNKELAAKVGLAPSSALVRVRRLRAAGVLRGCHADVDPNALGVGLQALIAVRLARHRRQDVDAFLAHTSALREVVGWFHVTGAADFLVHVAVRDADHLRDLAMDGFTTRDEVAHLETSLIFAHERKPMLPMLRRPQPRQPAAPSRAASAFAVVSIAALALAALTPSAATARPRRPTTAVLAPASERPTAPQDDVVTLERIEGQRAFVRGAAVRRWQIGMPVVVAEAGPAEQGLVLATGVVQSRALDRAVVWLAEGAPTLPQGSRVEPRFVAEARAYGATTATIGEGAAVSNGAGEAANAQAKVAAAPQPHRRRLALR